MSIMLEDPTLMSTPQVSLARVEDATFVSTAFSTGISTRVEDPTLIMFCSNLNP